MQLHVRNRIESSAQSRAQRKCLTSSGLEVYPDNMPGTHTSITSRVNYVSLDSGKWISLIG